MTKFFDADIKRKKRPLFGLGLVFVFVLIFSAVSANAGLDLQTQLTTDPCSNQGFNFSYTVTNYSAAAVASFSVVLWINESTAVNSSSDRKSTRLNSSHANI